MPGYTNIPKPTGTPYTTVNPIGKEQYDQANILYDDTTIFYDGFNPTVYTNVAKPSSPTWNSLTVAWNNYPYEWNNSSYILVAKPT